jgi:hypothetical protein
MRGSPFLMEFKSRKSCYTHLFVRICEEAGGFTVQARLYDRGRPANTAWGEEMADSFEAASTLVEVLAAEFSIPQARIKIEVRMHEMTNGTRH